MIRIKSIFDFNQCAVQLKQFEGGQNKISNMRADKKRQREPFSFPFSFPLEQIMYFQLKVKGSLS